MEIVRENNTRVGSPTNPNRGDEPPKKQLKVQPTLRIPDWEKMINDGIQDIENSADSDSLLEFNTGGMLNFAEGNLTFSQLMSGQCAYNTCFHIVIKEIEPLYFRIYNPESEDIPLLFCENHINVMLQMQTELERTLATIWDYSWKNPLTEQFKIDLDSLHYRQLEVIRVLCECLKEWINDIKGKLLLINVF